MLMGLHRSCLMDFGIHQGISFEFIQGGQRYAAARSSSLNSQVYLADEQDFTL